MSHKTGLAPLNNSVRRLGLNQTTPATGPAGSVSDLLFSEDGKKLLASVKGSPPTLGEYTPNAYHDAIFVQSAHCHLRRLRSSVGCCRRWLPLEGFHSFICDCRSTGKLTHVINALPSTICLMMPYYQPFGMALIPGKNALLATDPAVGATTFSLSLGSAVMNSSSVTSNSTTTGNSTSTSLTKAIPISGQGAVCWAAFSKKTGSFFLTDIATSLVTEVTVDDNLQGKVVKQYAQTPKSGTIDDAIGTIGGKE